MNAADFILENHGSLFLLHPQTPTARAWVGQYIDKANSYQPHWPTVVIEARYVRDIVLAIDADGFEIGVR